jgi:hypothetical protein
MGHRSSIHTSPKFKKRQRPGIMEGNTINFWFAPLVRYIVAWVVLFLRSPASGLPPRSRETVAPLIVSSPIPYQFSPSHPFHFYSFRPLYFVHHPET